MKADDLIKKFLATAGVSPEGGAVLRVFLAEQMETERKKAERLAMFESWVAATMPCIVEVPDHEPEYPWPASTPATVALHFCGLITNSHVGEAPGGVLKNRTFISDTNPVARGGTMPLYVAETETVEGDDVVARLVPPVYLGDATQRDAMAVAWGKITKLKTLDPSPDVDAKRKELVASFVEKYPGVAHHARPLLVSHGIEESLLDAAPASAALPPALEAVYAALLALAPNFLSAEGLPPVGADVKASKTAASHLATISDFGDYEAPKLLADLFIAWIGGDEAGAKDQAKKILAGPLGVPLTRRWASRVLGKAPTE